MYADTVTGSMDRAITETNRRRKIQQAYNEEHGIVPKTVKKEVHAVIEATKQETTGKRRRVEKPADIDKRIEILTDMMLLAAAELEFERAAQFRDELKELEGMREKNGK